MTHTAQREGTRTSALTQQISLYDEAISEARQLASSGDAETFLPRLQQVIQVIEQTSDPEGFKAGSLQDQRDVETLRSRIETLLELVAALQQHFEAARDRLLPRADQEIRAQRMLNAYGGGR